MLQTGGFARVLDSRGFAILCVFLSLSDIIFARVGCCNTCTTDIISILFFNSCHSFIQSKRASDRWSIACLSLTNWIYCIFSADCWLFWLFCSVWGIITIIFDAGGQAPCRGCTYIYTHKPTDQVFEVLTTRAIDNYLCSSTVQHA